MKGFKYSLGAMVLLAVADAGKHLVEITGRQEFLGERQNGYLLAGTIYSPEGEPSHVQDWFEESQLDQWNSGQADVLAQVVSTEPVESPQETTAADVISDGQAERTE